MASSQNIRTAVPGTFLTALGLAAGFGGFMAWDQSYWWRVKEDYTFGWLVPLFVLFVVYDRWAKILAALRFCASEDSPRVAGGQRWVLRVVLGASATVGALMFLLGSVLRAGVGTSQPATLAITAGVAAILLPLFVLTAPDTSSPRSSSLAADARVKLAALFLFPVLVWLVSAPVVSAVETQLNLILLRKVVSVVAFVFEVLGVPIEQQGNVLALPTGNVGVEDACSGIRSLTGCLFAGSFLAAVFVDRFWKKIALVSAALLFAFVSNLGRSLFLTAWAYNYGPGSIEGVVHDVAGYAVLGITVVGLVAVLPLLNLRFTSPTAVRSRG